MATWILPLSQFFYNGKTHLAISLAVAAAEKGKRVYFSTLSDLVLSLVETEKQGRLQDKLTALKQPSLLVVDEIGYLLSPLAARICFSSL